MLALAFAAVAVGFYAWIVGSAKEVASPLALWVNDADETRSTKAA